MRTVPRTLLLACILRVDYVVTCSFIGTVMSQEENDDYLMFELLKKELEQELFDYYGPLMTGEPLQKALGYISKEAFRQSLVRKTIPVHIFEIKHRRGKFALVKDVAQFLAEQRYKGIENYEK